SEKLKAITQKEILEKELVNSQEHRKVLNNELNASRREIISLKNSLEECEHKCHMMLTNAQVEMEQLKASKESELEQLLDEISRLRTELQNLNSSLVKERQSMIAKEQDLQGNLSVLRQQFWQQSRDMNQEKDKIEHKMKEILTEKDDLISHLKQEILSLKQKLSICSTSKAELEKEILTLRTGVGATYFTRGTILSGTLNYSTNVSIFERMEDDKFIMVLIIRRSPELWTIAKFKKIGKISRNINLQLFCELLDVIAGEI
ncbi:hypothetical protein TNCV_2717621, partial [Trichonephila clavipes]